MVDYTNHDYEALKDRITELYKDKPGIGEGYEGSTGQTLIQLLADVTDGLHYKLERRSQENYIATARLESSVWAAVSSFGYRPRRKVSASGKLLLELQDEDGLPIVAEGNIEIPYGKVIEFDGVPFMPAEDYVIRAGESSIEITVLQGLLEAEEYDFNALPYSDTGYIEIPSFRNIEEYSIRISSDQGEWRDVFATDNGLRLRALSFANRNQSVYDIRYTKEHMRFIFGDDTFGMAPEGLVNITWVRSLGDEVNVVRTGRLFSFEDEVLYDDLIITPKNEYHYKLSNTTPIRGGNSEESIEEIARNLPDYIRSNDRAVTNLDYEFWGMRSGIGGLLDLKAYGEAEINRLIFSMNNVYLSYVTPDREKLNTEQEEALRVYMNQVKVNTTHLVIRPASSISLGVHVEFRRHPSLPISNTQLYNEIRARVYDYFDITRDSIGKGFQHSEFVEYLQNLSIVFNGIRYMMTDFVKVKVDGVYPFTLPSPVYDGVVTLASDYVIVPNDVWTIAVNSEAYSVVVQTGDSVPVLVDKMKTVLFNNTGLMFASPAPNQIRITHPANEGSYTISVGNGDLAASTSFSQEFNVPRSTNSPTSGTDILLRESASVVDGSGNIILTDDGAGTMSGTGVTSTYIDYGKCRFQYPALPSGDYYFLFQQNQWQNFDVTGESYIDLMHIYQEGDNPDGHYFSSITLLD